MRVELTATEENASFTSTRLTSPIFLPAFSSATFPAPCRRPRQIGELVRDVSLRDDRREDLEPARLRELLARDDERAGAVVDPGRVPGCGRSLGIEHGLQRGQLFECRVAPRALVGRELADRNDLVREPALVRARRPRARGSAAPRRPGPRARSRARARRTTPARPCGGGRSSRSARRGSSDRAARRRRAGSRTAPSSGCTARSTSTPCRPRRRRCGRRSGSSGRRSGPPARCEAQTLLIVSAGTSIGSPAPTAACRAGAWPAPPWSTWPMITYSTSSSRRSTRSSAARIAIAPSSVASLSARPPPSLPNGVRTAETITERDMTPMYPHGRG